jgi:ferric-dicitrate binding protein FerR (iron transport regulator)
MNRKAFHQLLERYLDGSCSEEECRIVDQWYDLLEEDQPDSLMETNLLKMEDRLWNRIAERKDGAVGYSAEIPLQRKPFLLKYKWTAAAAVLFLAITSVYLFSIRNKPADSIVSNEVRDGMLETVNNTPVAKEIVLEDGSSVCLKPDGKIAYPRHFPSNKREIYLEGEAFFKVTKNPGRPFFVYNNNLVAEVLGTSFNIKIIQDRIEVAVKTGRVAVFENGKQISIDKQQKSGNGVIITPNQKVTYYPESRHFITSLVDAPAPVIADSSRMNADSGFVFDDAPLSEVLRALEKTYQIQIILGNENLGNCPFTGDIRKQNLFKKLELVCQVFQASYEIKGTMILIKGGKGCN